MVADGEIRRAGRSAPADAPRLGDPLDDAPRLRFGKGQAGRTMAQTEGLADLAFGRAAPGGPSGRPGRGRSPGSRPRPRPSRPRPRQARSGWPRRVLRRIGRPAGRSGHSRRRGAGESAMTFGSVITCYARVARPTGRTVRRGSSAPIELFAESAEDAGSRWRSFGRPAARFIVDEVSKVGDPDRFVPSARRERHETERWEIETGSGRARGRGRRAASEREEPPARSVLASSGGDEPSASHGVSLPDVEDRRQPGQVRAVEGKADVQVVGHHRGPVNLCCESTDHYEVDAYRSRRAGSDRAENAGCSLILRPVGALRRETRRARLPTRPRVKRSAV